MQQHIDSFSSTKTIFAQTSYYFPPKYVPTNTASFYYTYEFPHYVPCLYSRWDLNFHISQHTAAGTELNTHYNAQVFLIASSRALSKVWDTACGMVISILLAAMNLLRLELPCTYRPGNANLFVITLSRTSYLMAEIWQICICDARPSAARP